MFSNLSTVEIVLLLGAVGYVVYTFLPSGKGSISTSGIGDFFKKIRGTVEQATSVSDNVAKVSGVAIVEEWEDLYNIAESTGNKELMGQLDAMWPSLNPRLVKAENAAVTKSPKTEVPNE